MRMLVLVSGLVCDAGRRLSRGFGRFRGSLVRSLGGSGWHLCFCGFVSQGSCHLLESTARLGSSEDVQMGSSAKTLEVL